MGGTGVSVAVGDGVGVLDAVAVGVGSGSVGDGVVVGEGVDEAVTDGSAVLPSVVLVDVEDACSRAVAVAEGLSCAESMSLAAGVCVSGIVMMIGSSWSPHAASNSGTRIPIAITGQDLSRLDQLVPPSAGDIDNVILPLGQRSDPSGDDACDDCQRTTCTEQPNPPECAALWWLRWGKGRRER